MFIDRHQELDALEQMFQSGVAKFFVLYGRRRVGKTELLTQFCKRKRSIYFLASQLKTQDQLRQLTETARHVINDPLLQSLVFDGWESALIYFAQQAQEERLVLEKLIRYGITGGIPAYLNQFNTPQAILEQQIKDKLLTPQSYLFDEVNFLLRSELREPRTYASLLHAIAGGATRLNEISQRVGLDPTNANKYMSVLRELGLVRRETPVTERAPQRSRKGNG